MYNTIPAYFLADSVEDETFLRLPRFFQENMLCTFSQTSLTTG
jgi:hypothetical protein